MKKEFQVFIVPRERPFARIQMLIRFAGAMSALSGWGTDWIKKRYLNTFVSMERPNNLLILNLNTDK
jgi:hypothetical protein